MFKGSYVRSEETGQEVADDATNGVLSEDIESLIDANEDLDLGGEVASSTTNDAEDDSSPGRDETGAGRDGNETSDGARAEADGAPLALQAVVEEHPGEATHGRGEVGDDAGHDGTQVGGEGRAAVEAEPADPEEDGAEDDVRDVVGAERQAVQLRVASALAQHERVGESSSARRDVDGGTTGEVQATQDEGPAIAVPGPVGDRVVDDGRPDEDEDNGGQDAGAISSRTERDSRPVDARMSAEDSETGVADVRVRLSFSHRSVDADSTQNRA